ncbi:MAG TPA: C40 family peptidase [Chryseosolibacter sp.]|nr:C40 family peptidase [Chryseosolibacter sp.]
MRKEPTEQSEMVTQLLFGDHYEVLEISSEKKWLRVRTNFDLYEGWISPAQHQRVSKEYYDYIGRAEFKITTDVTSTLLYNKTPLHILMGSVIPISSSELFKMEEQFAFNGESKSLGAKREFDFVRAIAFKYLNAPYLWGGKSPFGIDCSGFVQMVFKIAGYRLFRDAWQQANQGKAVKSFDQTVPGDVAFFRNADKKITHTGIVIEKDRIVHASGRVRVDHFDERGIMNMETKSYTHELSHVRRILA